MPTPIEGPHACSRLAALTLVCAAMRTHIQTTGPAVPNGYDARNSNPYPIDSPHACSRIVALTLVCDGEVQVCELDRLDQVQGLARLGLTSAEFQWVVSDLCADLLLTAKSDGEDECRIDPMMIGQWMAEVHDATLQRTVVSLCSAVIRADGYVHESESMLMLAAVEHWGILPEGLEAFDPLSSEVDVVLSRRRREPVPDRPQHAAF